MDPEEMSEEELQQYLKDLAVEVNKQLRDGGHMRDPLVLDNYPFSFDTIAEATSIVQALRNEGMVITQGSGESKGTEIDWLLAGELATAGAGIAAVTGRTGTTPRGSYRRAGTKWGFIPAAAYVAWKGIEALTGDDEEQVPIETRPLADLTSTREWEDPANNYFFETQGIDDSGSILKELLLEQGTLVTTGVAPVKGGTFGTNLLDNLPDEIRQRSRIVNLGQDLSGTATPGYQQPGGRGLTSGQDDFKNWIADNWQSNDMIKNFFRDYLLDEIGRYRAHAEANGGQRPVGGEFDLGQDFIGAKVGESQQIFDQLNSLLTALDPQTRQPMDAEFTLQSLDAEFGAGAGAAVAYGFLDKAIDAFYDSAVAGNNQVLLIDPASTTLGDVEGGEGEEGAGQMIQGQAFFIGGDAGAQFQVVYGDNARPITSVWDFLGPDTWGPMDGDNYMRELAATDYHGFQDMRSELYSLGYYAEDPDWSQAYTAADGDALGLFSTDVFNMGMTISEENFDLQEIKDELYFNSINERREFWEASQTEEGLDTDRNRRISADLANTLVNDITNRVINAGGVADANGMAIIQNAARDAIYSTNSGRTPPNRAQTSDPNNRGESSYEEWSLGAGTGSERALAVSMLNQYYGTSNWEEYMSFGSANSSGAILNAAAETGLLPESIYHDIQNGLPYSDAVKRLTNEEKKEIAISTFLNYLTGDRANATSDELVGAMYSYSSFLGPIEGRANNWNRNSYRGFATNAQQLASTDPLFYRIDQQQQAEGIMGSVGIDLEGIRQTAEVGRFDTIEQSINARDNSRISRSRIGNV